jgi:hypothetical protein
MVARKTYKKKRTVLNKVIHSGEPQCHPRVKKTGFGCTPLEVLQTVAEGEEKSLAPAKMRAAIEKRLGIAPHHEYSFVEALPLPEQEKNRLLGTMLAPKKPDAWKSHPDKWLDSQNIEDVMKQYEEAYPDFEFMGPYPIDFAAPDPYKKDGNCLISEICNLRVQASLAAGKKKIGIIYNLDPHFKSGSHWVAAYIDIPGHKCYYFDSYGLAPPKQIATFMKWLTTQDPKMKLQYNARRFQFKNTECGVYSIYFILRMMKGDQFRSFTRQSPRDHKMIELRDELFSS